jgi:peroxiredoxin
MTFPSILRRIAPTLLLILGGGVGLWSAHRADAAVLPLPPLPWQRVDLRGLPRPEPHAPVAILYVQARCPHCASAAIYLDSLRRETNAPLFVASADSPADADAFAAKHRLGRPVIRDTARALRRALNVHAVPTLFVIGTDGRVREVIGAQSRAELRRALADIE